MELNIPSIKGHRRLAALFRRSLRRQLGARWQQRHHLRYRLRAHRRRTARAGWRRSHLRRSPDPQRTPWPHGRVGQLLRATVQLPRDSLLRHRRQTHRPQEQGDDQPCGKIRIPINESSDDKSQIQEYLHAYHGEGIQHVAFGTNDIYDTVNALTAKAIPFQTTPATYYEQLPTRIPNHGENTELLQNSPSWWTVRRRIQVCCCRSSPRTSSARSSSKSSSARAIRAFGEGNFKALFESIELDQIRRGVLQA